MKQSVKAIFEQDERDILEEGMLSKSNVPYQICLAHEDDIQNILELQARVYQDLPEAKKNFIVPKTEAFFQDHLHQGNPIMMVVVRGQCIAQSIIRAPSAADPHIGMTDMEELKQYPKESITILQGVVCDPAYRGNGLMEQMVGQWLNWAQENDRPYALAEIEVRNHHSWSVFMKQGMWLVGLGRDENDGANFYNAFQNLEEETGKVKYRVMTKLGAHFASAVDASDDGPNGGLTDDDLQIECDRRDLPRQNDLMQQGYCCGTWDSSLQKMTYKKRPF
jgi:RimJ/RimL family protein N-acetyltransferase